MKPTRGNFTSEEFESFTIEPDVDGGVIVYGHGTYARGSVLEGQYKRAYIEHFDNVEEAKVAFPQATEGHTQKPNADPGPIAPSWYDPTVHEEPWNED